MNIIARKQQAFLKTAVVLLIVMLCGTVTTNAQQGVDRISLITAIDELLANTTVPLRLPTYLATEHEEYPLLAIVASASKNNFKLEYCFSEVCGGASYFASISGTKIFGKIKRPEGKSVKVNQRINGYFVDATCGANCSDSTLTWDQDGYRYELGKKAGSRKNLAKAANSASLNIARESMTIQGGVLNGKAISLPKPKLDKKATDANAKGAVQVKVLVDPSGKVVEARAVGGNELLWRSAVEAAYNAKFKPTMIGGKPVSVIGVIIYNYNYTAF